MIKQYSLFVLAGAIPFIAAAAFIFNGVESIGPLRSVTESLLAYGLAIVSFVAGTHWGIYLQFKAAAPTNLFVSGNAAVLVPWLTFVVGSIEHTLIALFLTFVFLALVEWRLCMANLVTRTYFHMRVAATLIVGISLLLVLAIR